MVQKRGRARAKESNYTVIAEATSESRAREETNIIHEEMMLEAILEVQRMQADQKDQYDAIVSNGSIDFTPAFKNCSIPYCAELH